METKYLEIDLLSEVVKAAYKTIDTLKQQIVSLEERVQINHREIAPTAEGASRPQKALLIGDTKLSILYRQT